MSIEQKFNEILERVKQRAMTEHTLRELGMHPQSPEKSGVNLDEETRKKLELFMKNGDLAGIYNVVEHKLRYDSKLSTLLNAPAFRDEVMKMFRRQFAGKGIARRRTTDTMGATRPGLETTPGATSGRLGMLFIDLDDFKKLNDAKGHLVGDEALKAVAAALTEGTNKDGLREADIKGRFGGEELVVALEIENEGDHFRVAEKVRKLIEGIIIKNGDEELRLTASIGAAELQQGESFEDILERANWAMKYAKNHGKNTAVPEEVDEVRAWIAQQKGVASAPHTAVHPKTDEISPG